MNCCKLEIFRTKYNHDLSSVLTWMLGRLVVLMMTVSDGYLVGGETDGVQVGLDRIIF